MQLEDFRTILHNFDTEIGIPTLPVEKKERMITDEANSLRVDAISRSEVWLNTFNESAFAVNKRFNLNITKKQVDDIIGVWNHVEYHYMIYMRNHHPEIKF